MSAEEPFEGDEQRLSETDQTMSDADQDGSDLDQTASDVDQVSSERDQRASDRDQRAADLDQAASNRAQNAGLNAADYARTSRDRSQSTLERDTSSQARSDAARIRDATAERRDRQADARDAAAAARDELAAALDAEIDRLEESLPVGGPDGSATGLEVLLRALQDRRRAAASRQRAARQRHQASLDRLMAQADRRKAAEDRRAAAEELSAEGLDHLTGALRRHVGLAAIQRDADRTARTGEALTVAFVDVDGLKLVNDLRGHAAGDQLLRDVTSCIKTGLRPYDVVLRYGGDEIVCALVGEGTPGLEHRFRGDQAEDRQASTRGIDQRRTGHARPRRTGHGAHRARRLGNAGVPPANQRLNRTSVPRRPARCCLRHDRTCSASRSTPPVRHIRKRR